MTSAATKSELLLIEFVDQYVASRGLRKSTTVRGYRLAVNSLGHHLGRPVRIVELSSPMITKWAKSLIEGGFSPIHIDVMRRHIECLWRAAHVAELCDTTPSFRYHRGRAPHVAAKKALDSYLLYNDLKPSTQAYYQNIVNAFAAWAACDKSRTAFNAETVSEFLRDKQVAGARPWYVKSLRHGLKSLLVSSGDNGRIRTVKLKPLEVEVWREPEVAKLVAAIPKAVFPFDDSMHALGRRFFWRTIVLGAWYTGLSFGDLITLDESHVDESGRVEIRRSKTGKRVITWMPPELLADVSGRGATFWEPPIGPEQFRKEFRRIVIAAQLVGSFKKLRKSSGTRADELQPGRGHVHLGNTRRVFETHYQAADVHIEPIRLADPNAKDGAA
jgi:integrase